MTKTLLLIAVLCSAAVTTVTAQAPAAGVRFRVQLISSDTVSAFSEDPRVLRGISTSGFTTHCVRPDPGKVFRESKECGPKVREPALKLLAETSVTSDADGRAGERFTWSGGDAVFELDASALSHTASGESMLLRVRFWPRLGRGELAQPDSSLRMTHTAAPLGKAIRMYVMFKDGAQILLVVPESVPERTSRRPGID